MLMFTIISIRQAMKFKTKQEQYDALLKAVDLKDIWGRREYVILSLFLSSGISHQSDE